MAHRVVRGFLLASSHTFLVSPLGDGMLCNLWPAWGNHSWDIGAPDIWWNWKQALRFMREATSVLQWVNSRGYVRSFIVFPFPFLHVGLLLFDLWCFSVFCFSYLASLTWNQHLQHCTVIKIKYCLSSGRKKESMYFSLSKRPPHLPWYCLHFRTTVSFTSCSRKKMNTLHSTVDLRKDFWFYNAELLKRHDTWMISCH